MIDLNIMLNVLLLILVCWNIIDVHQIMKRQKVIEKIQDGDDDYEGEPVGKPKEF